MPLWSRESHTLVGSIIGAAITTTITTMHGVYTTSTTSDVAATNWGTGGTTTVTISGGGWGRHMHPRTGAAGKWHPALP